MAGFQPGKSGNPKGRPKNGNDFDAVLMRQLMKGSGRKAKEIADALIRMALSGKPGSVSALKLIAERIAGRPRQAAEPPKHSEQEILTKEQIDARLAELLARPEVKERIQSIIGEKGNVQ